MICYFIHIISDKNTFVVFYIFCGSHDSFNRECIECQRLSAVWEAVGATTRNRLNVARIEKDIQGAQTAKRFKVQKAPEFILYVDEPYLIHRHVYNCTRTRHMN